MKKLFFLIVLYNISYSCFAIELDFNHQVQQVFNNIWYQGTGGIGSIELASGKRFWLLSETFLDPDQPFRCQKQLVHNSLFIEDKVNNEWQSVWQYQQFQKERVLFSPPIEYEEKGKKKWYWLNTGCQLPNNEVVIFARMVETTGSFQQISKGDYLITHNVIIKIKNPDKPVEAWQIQTSLFPLILEKYVVSTSIVQKDNSLYLFFISANDSHPNAILAKINLQALSQLDNKNIFSFWSEQQWKSLTELISPDTIIEKTQAEQATFWHKDDSLFYHFWHETDNSGSQQLKSAASPLLEQPWVHHKEYTMASSLLKDEVFLAYVTIQTMEKKAF